MTTEAALIERLRGALDAAGALALFRRAIAAPSVTGAEAAFAALLADELTTLGAEQVTVTDFAPGRPNVRGVLRGAAAGPRVLLTGHTDTVHVRGWAERWAANRARESFLRRARRRGDLGARLGRSEGRHLRRDLRRPSSSRRGSPSGRRDFVRLRRRRRERRARQRRQRRHEGAGRGYRGGQGATPRYGDLRRADPARHLCRPDGVSDLRDRGDRPLRLFWRSRARGRCAEGLACHTLGAVRAFRRARGAFPASSRRSSRSFSSPR